MADPGSRHQLHTKVSGCRTAPTVALLNAMAAQLTAVGAVIMQYGEFRSGYDKDTEDTRLVFYGIRYLVENYVSRRWTMDDVEKAARFHRCWSS